MARKSYTEMTLQALRDQGCEVDIVERFIAQAGKAIPVKGNPHLRRRTGIRKDLFGIIDLIALRPTVQPIKISSQQIIRAGRIGGIKSDIMFNRLVNPPVLQGYELVGIQCFGQDFAAHKRKVLASRFAPIWLASGNAIELWGWRKLKVGKAEVWKPRVYRFQRGDFEITVPPTPQNITKNNKKVLDIYDIENLVDSL